MKDNRVNTESSRLRSLAFALAAFLLLVCVAFFIFTRLYGRYIDDILYKERQQQMKEVTVQLFKRLDDVTQRWWKDTDVFCGSIEDQAFASLDELYAYLQSLSQLYNVDAEQRHLVAVDESGSYLTHDGWNGTLSEMDFLLDSPERVSFVTSRVGRTDVGIFFLQKLPEPVTVRDGGETVRLTYFGLSCRLAELNPFFSCEAYDNNNSVYVLDPYGGRIFSSGDDTLLGYNAYATLKEMTYLHGTSFEAAKRELDSSGLAYSNAVLNGDEYYYALKKMNNADWTLLFLVSSDYVAQDVVLLVDTTARMVFAFAILLVIACTVVITFILTANQKRTLAIERENNDKLSAVNRELDQKNTELSAAVRLAESATQEAKAANRAKSEFLTNMSHDIRTPMNAILGITRLMENEQHLSDKMRGYIRKAHASGQHMLALINDVLDMSKIEAGKIRIVSEPVSLAEQIGQIDSIIRPRAAEKAQDFLIRTHDVTHEFLIGDSMRLGQILVNLLSNAVKYTPYGGAVRLDIAELPCVDAEHASLRIVVTDNGYGMTQEFLTHIFDPFTRAESSTTNKVQGTGLGMAITRNIVHLMNGDIQVDSAPNKGTKITVTVYLKLQESEKEQEKELVDLPVLVVDDDRTCCESTVATLEDIGIDGEWVLTGTEAVERCRARHKNNSDYFAVILDWKMPGMDGIETARNIRACVGEDVTIIILTAFEFSEIEEAARSAGVNAFIAKPLFRSRLTATLRQFVFGKKEKNARDCLEDFTNADYSGKRILLVEDNELNREIAIEIIGMTGVEIDVAENGKIAVDKIADAPENWYDLVFMDIQMPIMNGYEATAAIRSLSGARGHVPIIAMTANAFAEDVQLAKNTGMNEHMAKPLDMHKLNEILKTWL